MATTPEFVAYVCEQAAGAGSIRSQKMFGEYLVYVDEKPLLLVCDNTVYVKILPELAALLVQAERGQPYQGAKEHYILEIENRELVAEVLATLLPIIPRPKPKKKKIQR